MIRLKRFVEDNNKQIDEVINEFLEKKKVYLVDLKVGHFKNNTDIIIAYTDDINEVELYKERN